MWTYNDNIIETIPEGTVGFVYHITNLASGKRYVGKKNFYFSKTKQVKGKKKRIKVESDWKQYWSSSETLKADVEKLGPESFKREIKFLCKSKAEMSYFELREQIDNRVLESDEWYNDWISARIRRIHLTKTFSNICFNS